MKRLITAVMLVLALALSTPASAADLGGLYVAPKLLWSYQMHDNAQVDTDWTLGTMASYGANGKSDDTWGGALAVGYDFNPKFAFPVRAEIEYALRAQSKISLYTAKPSSTDYMDTTRKLDASTLFLNLYYDIRTGTKFTPYVGGGLGLAFLGVRDGFREALVGDSGSSSRDVTNFAWNVSAGVAYALDQKLGVLILATVTATSGP